MSKRDDHLAAMQAQFGFATGTQIVFVPVIEVKDEPVLGMLGDTWKNFIKQHGGTSVDFIGYLPSENYQFLGANTVHVRFQDGLEYGMPAEHFVKLASHLSTLI